MKNKNGVMIQYFTWYLNDNKKFWQQLKNDAPHLHKVGFSSVWMPPAYKGYAGKSDVGYGVYDMYDLGEFNQKGSVETKYGSKKDYLACIKSLHANDLSVYGDIVLNHRMGADDYEYVACHQVKSDDRNTNVSDEIIIKAPTVYNFPGRKDKYSSFHWNWTHFSGVDYDKLTNGNGPYLFCGKKWNQDVDDENGNYDFLMGADLDFDNPDTINEVYNWTKWYLDISEIDGLRMDALKHISSSFMKEYVKHFKKLSNDKLFVVGEYWNGSNEKLLNYLKEVDNEISLFDVALHFNFYKASTSNGEYDMSTILDNAIVSSNPLNAVTFVDNHDTEPNQGLSSWIPDWFKPLAYAIILLRENGYPCVFYGDYYGIEENNIENKQSMIDKLLHYRKVYNYGEQTDYFDDPNVIGWIKHNDGNPLVVIMSDNVGGSKKMSVSKDFAGKVFVDEFSNQQDVTIDDEGIGNFEVTGGSVSIYTLKKDN